MLMTFITLYEAHGNPMKLVTEGNDNEKQKQTVVLYFFLYYVGTCIRCNK